MVALFLLSAGACNAPSRFTLSNIKLTETERAWKNPEEKNSELVKLYGDMSCSGTSKISGICCRKNTQNAFKTLKINALKMQ